MRLLATLASVGLAAGCTGFSPDPVGQACAVASPAEPAPAGMVMAVGRGGAHMNVEAPGKETACSNGHGFARCSVNGPLLAAVESPGSRTVFNIPADQRATLTHSRGQARCVLHREPA